MNNQIGQRLLELREEKELTQAQLAEKLDVSRTVVSNWEKGKVSPNTEDLIKLSQVYNLSLDELVNNVDIEEEFVEPVYKNEVFYIVKNVICFLTFIGVLISYLLIGIINHIWHPSWILFLFVPIVNSIFDALEKNDLKEFSFTLLIVCIYLVLGLEYSLWHPYWCLFLLIPIFYLIAKLLEVIKNNKK